MAVAPPRWKKRNACAPNCFRTDATLVEQAGSEFEMENGDMKPIAIYYEQPNWFVPLFKEMDKRGVPWVKLDARYHQYDAASAEQE